MKGVWLHLLSQAIFVIFYQVKKKKSKKVNKLFQNFPIDEAPQEPEPWEKIMSDVEDKIMPGVTHWQHPRFHAYFPAGNSFPSMLGDMLGDGIGCIGFSWAASPACTELETIVLDWLGNFAKTKNDLIYN